MTDEKSKHNAEIGHYRQILFMDLGIFLKIRLLQVYRLGQGIGLIRTSLILLFLCLGWLGIYQLLTKDRDTHQAVLVASIFCLLLLQIKRKDYSFVVQNRENPFLLFFAEYLCLFSPVLLLFIFTSSIYNVIFLLLSMFIVALFVKPVAGMKLKKIDTIAYYIPSDLFEWKFGVRKYFIFIFLIYFLGLIFSFYNVIVPLVALIILSIIVCNFYLTSESRELLEAKELGAKSFIIDKLKRHILFWLLVALPLLISTLFHYHLVGYVLVAVLMLLNLIVCIILLKYLFYEPNQHSFLINFLAGLIIIFAIVPGLCFVILFLNIYFYNRVIRHLDTYLHDYN